MGLSGAYYIIKDVVEIAIPGVLDVMVDTDDTGTTKTIQFARSLVCHLLCRLCCVALCLLCLEQE